MPKYKIARIASDIQRYLGDIIINDVNDEILKSITITGCDVTNDLSYAKVYFTVLDDSKKEEVLKSLNKAANFIEISLSKKIDIRKMPQISFHYDNSYEYGKSIEEKIKEIHAKENK